MKNHIDLSIIVEKDADGFVAFCHELQGCYAQGDSYDDVMKNIREVIELHIKDREAREGLGSIVPSHETTFTKISLPLAYVA